MMLTPANLHLIVNHVPVIGIPGATLLLLGGLLRKSRDIVQAAFLSFVLVALFTFASDRTGGPAAHQLKQYPEVVRAQVHEHAEAADFGLGAGIALGVLSLVGLFLSRRGNPPKAFSIVVLVVGLWASTVMARVAHLGGMIRHPEISDEVRAPTMDAVAPTSATAPVAAPVNKDKDDDGDDH